MSKETISVFDPKYLEERVNEMQERVVEDLDSYKRVALGAVEKLLREDAVQSLDVH